MEVKPDVLNGLAREGNCSTPEYEEQQPEVTEEATTPPLAALSLALHGEEFEF